MPYYNVVVIGASAGGVEALKQLVAQLPDDLAAAVFVVMHFPANSVSILPKILSRYGPLPAVHPENGEQAELRRIYVAPPDHHLLVQPNTVSDQVVGTIQLTRSPRENGHRPAIDILFRSASRGYGPRAVGIILSGTMDDGVAGLMTIKARGGLALVQDPQEALFDAMPRNAINNVKVDAVLPVAGIAARLAEITQIEIPQENTMSEMENGRAQDKATSNDPFSSGPLQNEAEQVAQEKFAAERGERLGAASPFTCPDCGGVL